MAAFRRAHGPTFPGLSCRFYDSGSELFFKQQQSKKKYSFQLFSLASRPSASTQGRERTGEGAPFIDETRMKSGLNNVVDWRPQETRLGESETTDHSASWRTTMREFWESRGCKEEQTRQLMQEAECLPGLRNAEHVADGLRKLGLLLPDAGCIQMLEREPELLEKLNMVRAAHLILDLQEFLDRESISSVTEIFEDCPSLLWQKSIGLLVDGTVAQIEHVLPGVHALTLVKEYPNLMYSSSNYHRCIELPVDIHGKVVSDMSYARANFIRECCLGIVDDF
ncbi:hypothetical protein CYMTET_13924 [Cymbomonas tetramitiformis]|uniref:Uncharacterized protein n=1 Tax=Cymbomonas tetramitiformis TaxID=36881 RepID=A0AAE0LAQ4_9CHLO|nr:hypothetical protein CYMTET_13924 [Cymbomonas tetramitiformis]